MVTGGSGASPDPARRVVTAAARRRPHRLGDGVRSRSGARRTAAPVRGTGAAADARRVRQALRISRASWAVSDGVLPTFTPAASRASFFACAVPDEPDTIAPA